MSQVKRKAEEDKSHEITKKFKLETKEDKPATKASFERPPWLVVAEPDGDHIQPFFAWTGGTYCIAVPDEWIFRAEIIPVITTILFPIPGVAGVIADYMTIEGQGFDVFVHTQWDDHIEPHYWSGYFGGWHEPDSKAQCMVSEPFVPITDVAVSDEKKKWFKKYFQRHCQEFTGAACCHAVMRYCLTVPILE